MNKGTHYTDELKPEAVNQVKNMAASRHWLKSLPFI